MGLILITHDLGVVAGLCERVMVMYAGRIVEEGPVDPMFEAPMHPYTLGLMMSLPRLTRNLNRLRPIPGQPPSLLNRPPGCAFHPRCGMSAGRTICREMIPELSQVANDGHFSACHFHNEVARELEMQASDLGLEAHEGQIDVI